MNRIVISVANNFEQDRRMLRTADALQEHGYDIIVIDKKTNDSPERPSTIPTNHISCWIKQGFLFYFEFNIRLFFKLLSTPTDILLSVDSDTLLASTMASIIKSKPLIIDMHELFTEVPELEGRPLKKRIWRWIEKFGISRSSKRYTVSQTIAREYESRYGRSFELIRNVPPTSSTVTSLKPKRFTMAYIGAINMGRGLSELIHALVQVQDVDLMIYGTGDLYQELQELVKELQLTNRVHFSGWIKPDDIHGLLQKVHVGVNLLDPSSQSYYLSLANKYFDYIHAELPILSMNFPEYQSLNSTHRTSILLDDLNEGQIINAIQQMKNDKALYTNLSANCRIAKEEWNWQTESKRLVSIFDF